MAFTIRSHIRSGKEEVDLYLYEMENYLQSFDTSSIKQMLIALDNICFKMTDDLDKISEGDTDGLVILSDSKDSKVFDRLMTLIQRVKDIKAVCDLAESLRPEVEEIKNKAEEVVTQLDPTLNPFEQIQEKFNKKHKKP